MSASLARPDIFVVGGTVQASDGVYLERPADQELLELCLKNEYAYVLTPRQMGKSSLMVNTSQQLAQQGIKTALVDLTAIGGSADASQWFFGILTDIEYSLKLETNLVEWWESQARLSPAQRFSRYFETVLLNQIPGRVVVFLDEIDTTLSEGVRTYADDFFAAIRALYSARARSPELKRLSFVLIGVATPNELINDPKRTPFNIGHSVDLNDFTLQQAKPLIEGFGLSPKDGEAVLAHVLKWTGGHPYLTQRICKLIAEAGARAWSEKDVDDLVASTYFTDQGARDNNLVFVRNMLLERAPEKEKDVIISTYRDIRRGDRVPDEERSIVKSHLKISGLVRSEAGILRVRNAIYERVFNQGFIDQHLSEESARRALQAANERAEEEKRLREEEVKKRQLEQVRNVYSRWIGGAFTLAVAIAAVFFVLQANERTRLAQIDKAAEAALNKLEKRYDQALLVSAAANQMNDDGTTKNALFSSVQASSPNLTTVLYGHNDKVSSVAFSPDGTLLASGSYNGTVRLWDTSKRIAIGNSLQAHKNVIWSTVFSPDGKTLATASFDKTVCLWNVSEIISSQQQKCQPLIGHTGKVRGIAFSPDGTILASGSEDKTILLWNVSNREKIGTLQDPGTIYSVSFSPDGKLLASGGDDLNIRLWNVSSRKEIVKLVGLTRLPSSHTQLISSVVFSPDGKTLASASYDQKVKLWNVSSALSSVLSTKKNPMILEGHTGQVDSVVFSPDGKMLVSSGMDKTIRLWSVSSHTEIQKLEGHSDIVFNVAFSPDGKTLASGSFDQSIRLWDVSSRQKTAITLSHKGYVSSVAVSPDGKTLATANSDTTAYLWDIFSQKQIGQLQGHARWVFGVAFSPNGKTLATGSDDQTIRLWDVVSRMQIGEPLTGHSGYVWSLAFSPDGKMLASGGLDNSVRLWDVLSHKQIGEPLHGHIDSVLGVAFSPDGKTLASGSLDKTVRLWDVTSHKQIGIPFTQMGSVSSVAFSPDGKTLATGSLDMTVRLWDVTSHKQIGTSLTGHTGYVSSVGFSPDGKTLVSGGNDKTVRLWDVLSHKQIGASLTGHSGYVLSVVFSPDGKTLASGGNDNTARLWDINLESWRTRACSIVNRNLTQAEWRDFFGSIAKPKTCPALP